MAADSHMALPADRCVPARGALRLRLLSAQPQTAGFQLTRRGKGSHLLDRHRWSDSS